jgi:hypothetical protein
MDVLQLDVDDEEEVLARVAAIDVAKATGMVCTRVPHENSPGRRVTKVWQVSATTNAIMGLGTPRGRWLDFSRHADPKRELVGV